MARTGVGPAALLLAVFAAQAGAAAVHPVPAGAEAGAADLDVYATLLARYVTPTGVRYAAWRSAAEDRRALAGVVRSLLATDPAPLPPDERFALLINLYNAKILELVIEGAPERSIKELSRGLNPYEIFKREILPFAGATISLEALEARLREESNDPRVHFAVNCASRSCPPILDTPFRAVTLDAQLAAVTRSFLAAPGALALRDGRSLLGGERLVVSCTRLLDWYAGDFARWLATSPATHQNSDGRAAFLARWAQPEIADRIARAGEAVDFEFQDYDWTLNDAQ